MSKKIPRISDAEWQVMNIIWEQKHVTSNTIVTLLSKTNSWGEKTVKTLIRRLVDKGVVGFEKDSEDKRVYYYYPKIEKDLCVRRETNIFLDKFYDGLLTSMVSRFVKENAISEKEKNELIELLNKENGKEE